jgi:putative membrane-bound dehydrogenase-like protein
MSDQPVEELRPYRDGFRRRASLALITLAFAATSPLSAAEDIEVPGASFYLTIELGEDRGQNHGTLFEARDQDGRRLAGAGFLGAYNTYSRNERELVHFFVETGDNAPRFTPEPLPRVNTDAGVYLSDQGGELRARSRGGADSVVKVWDQASGKWLVDQTPDATHVRVAGKTLTITPGNASYAGREILTVGESKTRLGESYYAGGRLIFRQHAADASPPVNRLVACDWTPADPRATPLNESLSIELRTPREFVYAYGQLDHEVIAATNTGGIYTLSDGEWRCFLEPDTQVSFQVYAIVNYRDRLLLGHYPTGELYEYDGNTLRLLANWPPTPRAVRKQAREAQTLTIYGGDLYCGVWPWAEVWRYDESASQWSLRGRLFDHPPPTTETTHPYEKETSALGAVLNRWGQRVTSMVPLGDALYLSTSAKNSAPWEPRFAFLDQEKQLDYGKVYRYRQSGALAAPLTWMNGRTHLEFRFGGDRMRIFQDHTEIASTRLRPPIGVAPKTIDVTWGDGIFGEFRGRIVSREARPRNVGAAAAARFPPLQVPPGFQATLFACDPLIEYTSSIALGPRPNTVFVAQDYLTGYGTEIIRHDEIRLVEDTDGDGFADSTTLFAAEFNSIQGLTFDGDTLYAVHAPILTALTDTDGDGVADQRRDFVSGLGLAPKDNPVRLHCASGIQIGHDNWLYIALGDHGCDVERPEGDRLVLEGGGILRVRPDGTGLHVFSTGLRNIYDVALDADLNVLGRDNENDGGDYMIRWYESFHGADHGYPYLYYEQPSEAMPPLADLGRGSSAGGVAYLEDAFPEEYKGSLLFCEWGRSVVRYPLERAASDFKTQDEIELARGAESDPYGFKPTDLVVDHDGSLLVADWSDGQRPHRGRARLYRISASDAGDRSATDRPSRSALRAMSDEVLLKQLDAPGYQARYRAQREASRRGAPLRRVLENVRQAGTLGDRARRHAVWLLAAGDDPTDTLFDIARHDPLPAVRQQAVRALADLHDPILAQGRLDAGGGEVPDGLPERLASVAFEEGATFPLRRAVVVAIGRLRWNDTPIWLWENQLRLGVEYGDTALEHAVQQALRRAGNWPAVLDLIEATRPTTTLPRIALRALARQYDVTVADGLLARLSSETEASRRAEYVDLLSRIYQQPDDWVYWGYRPPARPRSTREWARTREIGEALEKALGDVDHKVRVAALGAMQREGVPSTVATLDTWLREETDAGHTTAILDALGKRKSSEARESLTAFVQDPKRDLTQRRETLAGLLRDLPPEESSQLIDWAKALERDALAALVVAELGQRPDVECWELLRRAAESEHEETRHQALRALASRQTRAARPLVKQLLSDATGTTLRDAVLAAGELGMKETEAALLKLGASKDDSLRAAVLTALLALDTGSGTELARQGLADRESLVPALDYLIRWSQPDDLAAIAAVAKHERSSDVLTRVATALVALGEHRRSASTGSDDRTRDRKDVRAALADIQGACGTVLSWDVAGPLAPGAAHQLRKPLWILRDLQNPAPEGSWQRVTGKGPDATVQTAASEASGQRWLATSELHTVAPIEVEFLLGSSGTLTVWLDKQVAYRRQQNNAFRPDSDRFPAHLDAGLHRLTLEIASATPPTFHLRFRERRAEADRERLLTSALSRTGNAGRGRAVFLDAGKSQCIKCHRLGEEGGRIGPALTGIGRRFSRIHLVESILEPSRTMAPSYGTVGIVLTSGQVLSGVRIAETADTVTLGDAQGQAHVLQRSEIAQLTSQEVSTMPEGLEKQLSEQEFLDLLAFLLEQKD